MKRLLFHTCLVFSGLAPFSVSLAQNNAADEIVTLDDLFNHAQFAAENNQWDKAAEAYQRIIKEYESDAASFGPKFGFIYYQLGVALKNLGKKDDAFSAFKTSREKYPNKPDTLPDQKNPAEAFALLEMGAIEQERGKFAEALENYEAFLKSNPDPSNYDAPTLTLQAAICYAKVGKIDESKKLILGLMSNTSSINPLNLFTGVVNMLEGMVESIKTAEKPADKQKVVSELLEFLNGPLKNLRVPPSQIGLHLLNQRLMNAAHQLSEGGHSSAALKLVSITPSISDIVRDLERHKAIYGGNRVDEELTKWKQEIDKEDGFDVVSRLMLAAIYEREGDLNAAFGNYQFLEVNKRKNAKYYADFLYGCVRTAILSGNRSVGETYGNQFLKQFPTHEYAESVSGLMLETRFYGGDYAGSLEIASRLRETLKEGPMKDFAQFVMGAANFYLGDSTVAQVELERHFKEYPKSAFIEHTKYLYASTFIRLQDHAKGKELLTAFLKEYPKSVLRGPALLDRGTANLNLGDNDGAVADSNTLLEEFPNFPELDRVYSLRGDAYYQKKDYPSSSKDYEEAIKIADKSPEREIIAARARAQLINIYVELKDNDNVLKMYDEFMQKHPENFYEGQVAVGSMPVLIEAKRGMDGIEKMEKFITRMGAADSENAGNLEEIIGSYMDFAVKSYENVQTVEKRLQEWPAADGKPLSQQLQAWLIMARIDLVSSPANQEKFPTWQASQRVAFGELQKFDKKSLSTYIVFKVGSYLADQTTAAAKNEAKVWLDEVVSRGPSELRPIASMRIAKINLGDGSTAAKEAAMSIFNSIIADKDTPSQFVEEASIEKARLLHSDKKFKEAAALLLEITNNRQWTRDRAEMRFLLGDSYEQLQDWDNALRAYASFMTAPLESQIRYSTEARYRSAIINAEKKDKKDIKAAYFIARDTISRMYRLENSPEDLNQRIKAFKPLYKKWQQELKEPADPEKEALWGI